MTRQIANVLEDLDRQLLTGASISLLYGLNGVGKTRLLHQFITFRLHRHTPLFLTFTAEGTYTQDGESYSQLDFERRVLQHLDAQSVLILDQFEHALAEIQRRILKFWSSVAEKRGMKLIISGNQQLLGELSSLTDQFPADIKSVELRPLSAKDRLEYLAAQICISSTTRLVFPGHVKKLIKQTNGLFARLDSLCQQHASDFDCQQKKSSRKIKPAVSLMFISVVVLAVVVLVIYKTMDLNTFTQAMGNKSAREPVYASISALKTDVQTQLIIKPQAEQLVDRFQNQVNIDDLPEEKIPDLEVVEEPELPEEKNIPQASMLQQRLQATEHWLEKANGRSASIQVMTLSFKQDVLDSLNRYLQTLESGGMELDNIFIYAAPKTDSRVYGVLYGSYSSRQQAIQNLNSLPKILQADKPIPRTVRGIRQEISQTN